LSIDNFSEVKLTASLVELEPADEELGEGEGLLGSVDVNPWHVHIVDEDDHLFARCLWAVVFEGPLVDVFFNDVLEVERGSSRREVDVQEHVFFLVEFLEACLHSYGLCRSGLTAEHHWGFPLHALVE
jgi:hypothetical protein